MHTALVVVVPEAEGVVGRHRAVLDGSAAWDVPAHVTVLFPFLPLPGIDLAALRRLFAGIPRFEARLERVGWFGDSVAWLAPEPAGRFRELTAAVWERFPQAPPYEGVHDDVIPHLTIGHDRPRPVLEAAAADITPHLPIAFGVTSVRLMTGRMGSVPWRTVADLDLDQASTSR